MTLPNPPALPSPWQNAAARVITEAGDRTETFWHPAPTSVPDLNPPRSRKVARRQAARDAKVLARMRKADIREWQARRADEQTDIAREAAKAEHPSGWQEIGTTTDGGVVHIAPVGTPLPVSP